MHASGVFLPITTVCSLSLVRYKLSLGIMTLGSELLNARIPPSPPPPLLCVLFLSLSLSRSLALSFSCARTHVCLCVPLSLCLSCVSPCLRWVEFGKSNNNYPKDFSPGDPPPQPKGSAAKKARSKGSLSFCLSLERELDANGLHAL
jgi:hypothetical protein